MNSNRLQLGITLLSLAASALCCGASEIAVVNWDNALIASGVRAGLGDPARFNWESVRVTELRVEGGAARAELARDGANVRVKVSGDHLFSVTAKGTGDRSSSLDLTAGVRGLNASVSLAEKQAEVDVVLHIVNRESCRAWTRAKNQKTTPWSKMTFRVTAIPKPCEFDLICRVRLQVRNDGTLVLIPVSWRPRNQEDKIDIKISGQNLPDGWAVIKPLDVESIKVDMDIPFGAGDKTIANPLKKMLNMVIGREFALGKLPI